MPRPANTYRYPWPASAITTQDMAMLHKARESGRKRVPITSLVAEAVRVRYGRQTQTPNPDHHPQERKTA
jgi:hypothetical protein